MKYNFDVFTDRAGTNSVKWMAKDVKNSIDYVPLWVADMDFDVAPDIVKALQNRADHPIYGYTVPDGGVFDAIINWQAKRNNARVEKDEIIFSAGVVYSYYNLIRLTVKEDEKIIINSPIYGPFYMTPESLDREVVYCPMIETENGYEFDFETFEEMLKNDPKIRLFDLCNPYNPLGKCFTLDELNRIMEICHRYDVYVSSDEIHADVILEKGKFNTTLNTKEEYQDKLVVSFSPTKGFNLAGIKASYVVIRNKELREKFEKIMAASGTSEINIFGYEAIKAAYTYGEEWLDECIAYIKENFNLVKRYLSTQIPTARFFLPEATYLGFIDLRDIDLPKDFVKRLIDEAHVQFNDGEWFKADYRFIRINVACPRAQLLKGLDALKNWLTENKYI